MADIEFSSEASLDLATAYAYGAELYGLDAALDYHRDLQGAVERLSTFPEVGPVYPRLRPPIRFLTFRRHHIFYDYDGKKVRVIRILHHSQDVAGLL